MTRDSEKMLCCLYKEYLERINHSSSKSAARKFKSEYFTSDSVLSTWHPDDISSTKASLHKLSFVKENIIGDVELTDDAIAYMEKRFSSNITEVTKYLFELIKDVAIGLIP